MANSSSSRKRLFESTSSVDTPTQDATIHGVVNFLSPVKKAKTTQKQFFNGNLTDEKKSMRLVALMTSNNSNLNNS